MNTDIFWQIIALLDWKKTGNDDGVLRPAVKKLASMEIEDIFKFDDILAEHLFKLDGLKYAENIGTQYYTGDDHAFSVDYFLYVRCCVVANGKAFYDSVLARPDRMPQDMDFEALLYLARTAYKKKTGSEDYEHDTEFNFETFSNKAGWKDLEKKPWWKFWEV